jgi:hypothetical protein
LTPRTPPRREVLDDRLDDFPCVDGDAVEEA